MPTPMSKPSVHIPQEPQDAGEPTPDCTLDFTSSAPPSRNASPSRTASAEGGHRSAPDSFAGVRQQVYSQVQPEAQPALDGKVVNRTITVEGVRFCGRRQELQKLEQHFKVSGQGGEKVAILFGETEFGKSTLAEEFIRLHSNRYGMVLWLSASQATLNSQCMRVAKLLGQNVDEVSGKALDGDNQWQRIVSAILAARADPILLVLDDLEELGKLSIFLSGDSSRQLNILVTTRALKASLKELQLDLKEDFQGLPPESIILIRVGFLEKQAEKDLLGDCFEAIGSADLDRMINNLKRKPSLLAEAHRVSASLTEPAKLVDKVEFGREEAFTKISFIIPLDFTSAAQNALDELRFGSSQGAFPWTLFGRLMSLFGSQVGWWAWTVACVSAFFNRTSIPEDLLSEAAFRLHTFRVEHNRYLLRVSFVLAHCWLLLWLSFVTALHELTDISILPRVQVVCYLVCLLAWTALYGRHRTFSEERAKVETAHALQVLCERGFASKKTYDTGELPAYIFQRKIQLYFTQREESAFGLPGFYHKNLGRLAVLETLVHSKCRPQTAPQYHAMWFKRDEVFARLPGQYHSLLLPIGLELAKHYIHIGGQFEAAEHIARVGLDLARVVSQQEEKATLLFGFAHCNIKAKLKAANDVRAVQQMRERLVPEMRETAQQTKTSCKHQVKSDICEAQVEEAMGNYKEAFDLYESALARIKKATLDEGKTLGSSMWKLRVKALRNQAFLEHYMGRHASAQQILKILHDERELVVREERRKQQERAEGRERGEAVKEAELDFARAQHELGQGEFWVSQENEEKAEKKLEAREGRQQALDLFEAALQKSAAVLGKKINHQDLAMSYVAINTVAIEQRLRGDITGAHPLGSLSGIHAKLRKAFAIEKIVLSDRHPLIARTLIVKALWLKLLSNELAAIQPDQSSSAELASFICNEWTDQQLEDWAAQEELSDKERTLAKRLQAASKGDIHIAAAGLRSVAGDLAIEALEQARDIQKQVLSDKHPAIAETLFLLSGFQAARQIAKPVGALWTDRWGWNAVLHSSADALEIMRRLQSDDQLRRRIEERTRLCLEASRQWIERRVHQDLRHSCLMSCDFYLETWGAHYEVRGVERQGPFQLKGRAETPLALEIPGTFDFSSGLTLEIWLALDAGTKEGTPVTLQVRSNLRSYDTAGPFVALGLCKADPGGGAGNDLLWQAILGEADNQSATLVKFKEAQVGMKRGEVVARTVSIHLVLQRGVGDAPDSVHCFRDGLLYGETKSADLAALLAQGACRLVLGGTSEEEASATIFLIRLYKGALEPAAIKLCCSTFERSGATIKSKIKEKSPLRTPPSDVPEAQPSQVRDRLVELRDTLVAGQESMTPAMRTTVAAAEDEVEDLLKIIETGHHHREAELHLQAIKHYTDVLEKLAKHEQQGTRHPQHGKWLSLLNWRRVCFEKQNEYCMYRWHFHEKRGMALVVNMEFNREGASRDTHALKKVLKELKFDLGKEDRFFLVDPTGDQVKDAVRSIAEHVDSRHDGFACILMAHGGRSSARGDYINVFERPYGTGTAEGKPAYVRLYVANLKRKLGCISGLKDKPKVLLVNACRGAQYLLMDGEALVENGVRLASRVFASVEDWLPFLQKPRASDVGRQGASEVLDILHASSTVEGVASPRLKSGTPFVQQLCRSLPLLCDELDLQEILREVRKELSREVLKGRDRSSGEVLTLAQACIETVSTLKWKLYWRNKLKLS